jgi:hypothetical protein
MSILEEPTFSSVEGLAAHFSLQTEPGRIALNGDPTHDRVAEVLNEDFPLDPAERERLMVEEFCQRIGEIIRVTGEELVAAEILPAPGEPLRYYGPGV